MRNQNTIFGPETERNPPARQRRFRYVVQNIYLSERADWDPGEQAFLEMELDRLTEDGEKIISLLKDCYGDYEVVLEVEIGGEV